MWKTNRTLFIILLFSTFLSIFFCWTFATKRCDMASNLTPLFVYATNLLNSVGAQYWIDYGTLLGGVREGALLAHEFDLDLGATEEECPTIIQAVKQKVKDDGNFAYERNEWIDKKYNPILGHDGYLHKPCLRIYDANHVIYVDIDGYRSYSPKEIIATQAHVASKEQGVALPADLAMFKFTYDLPKRKGGLDIPADYDPKAPNAQNLLCNEEGYDGGDEGGCRPADWMLPPRQFRFSNGIQTYAPKQVERNLEAMYGADWVTPRGKGYKLVMCSWFPLHVGGLLALIACTLFGPALVYFVCSRYATKLYQQTAEATYTLLKKDASANIVTGANYRPEKEGLDLELAMLKMQREDSDSSHTR